MLHDTVATRLARKAAAGDDRRESPRVPFPAEITIGWHHDFATTMRYRVIDVSDDGFRIQSSTPLLEGMTGTALRLLPEGHEVNQSVMVAWMRRCDCDDPGNCDQCPTSCAPTAQIRGAGKAGGATLYEIGLRRF